MTFKRERRYFVVKLADVPEEDLPELLELTDLYEEARAEMGKPPLECLVLESDWPEYEPAWASIEARMTN